MIDLPKILIVTPSLNQVAFIEKTLQSIHNQDYQNLEHIVMDGGSTDGSLDVIKRYSDRLSWVSEPDDGQYQAIAKGFARANSEVMAWLNSDDIYLPGTLRVVGEIFRDLPDVEWITTRFPVAIDGNGAIFNMGCFPGFSRQHFLHGDYLPACGWRAMDFIQQESTFWRRSLWERAGAMFRDGLNYAGDFELWSRFFQHAQLYGVDVLLAVSDATKIRRPVSLVKNILMKPKTFSCERAEKITRINPESAYGLTGCLWHFSWVASTSRSNRFAKGGAQHYV